MATALDERAFMQRAFRLRDNDDFQRVHRAGQRLANHHLVLVHLPNGQATSRVGFAVGKKLGGAVVRNRVKRRLRALMEARLRNDVLPGGMDLVIIARQPTVEATFAQLSEAIDDLLRRAQWRER